LFSTLYAQYQAEQKILDAGPGANNPQYGDIDPTAHATLGKELASMWNNINTNNQKASDTTSKATPANADTIQMTWPDFNDPSKNVTGPISQYVKELQANTQSRIAAGDAKYKTDIAALQADVASGKTTSDAAIAQAKQNLADIKEQLSPAIATLTVAQQIADMTMRGPVIPALLEHMAPNGTNATMANIWSATPGVPKGAVTPEMSKDIPLAMDPVNKGTQTALYALKNISPWAAQQLAGAQGAVGQTPQASAAASNAVNQQLSNQAALGSAAGSLGNYGQPSTMPTATPQTGVTAMPMIGATPQPFTTLAPQNLGLGVSGLPSQQAVGAPSNAQNRLASVLGQGPFTAPRAPGT